MRGQVHSCLLVLVGYAFVYSSAVYCCLDYTTYVDILPQSSDTFGRLHLLRESKSSPASPHLYRISFER